MKDGLDPDPDCETFTPDLAVSVGLEFASGIGSALGGSLAAFVFSPSPELILIRASEEFAGGHSLVFQIKFFHYNFPDIRRDTNAEFSKFFDVTLGCPIVDVAIVPAI